MGAVAHSLKVEINYGNGYLDMGTTDFMSVPYSLHAKTAANGSTTDELQTLSISGDTLFISNSNYIILPTPTLLGCMDSTAANYDPNANVDVDDGSCCYIAGCMDATALNYDPNACEDDGSCSYSFGGIGDIHQGGIVFYLDGNGGGLIAAPSNQGTAEWGCYGTLISGADGTSIGTGSQNTIDILNGCSQLGTAAYICDTLTLGGYSDWFLPSKDELNEMYSNIGQGNALGLGNIGGFASNYYWSSTEFSIANAWIQNFYNGFQEYFDKSYDYGSVRAVRAF